MPDEPFSKQLLRIALSKRQWSAEYARITLAGLEFGSFLVRNANFGDAWLGDIEPGGPRETSWWERFEAKYNDLGSITASSAAPRRPAEWVKLAWQKLGFRPPWLEVALGDDKLDLAIRTAIGAAVASQSEVGRASQAGRRDLQQGEEWIERVVRPHYDKYRSQYYDKAITYFHRLIDDIPGEEDRPKYMQGKKGPKAEAGKTGGEPIVTDRTLRAKIDKWDLQR